MWKTNMLLPVVLDGSLYAGMEERKKLMCEYMGKADKLRENGIDPVEAKTWLEGEAMRTQDEMASALQSALAAENVTTKCIHLQNALARTDELLRYVTMTGWLRAVDNVFGALRKTEATGAKRPLTQDELFQLTSTMYAARCAAIQAKIFGPMDNDLADIVRISKRFF